VTVYAPQLTHPFKFYRLIDDVLHLQSPRKTDDSDNHNSLQQFNWHIADIPRTRSSAVAT